MVKIVLLIATGFILLSLLISLYRFLVGPQTLNRVIAFDVMTISSIGLIGIVSLLSGRGIYLDIALVYGLLSFLAVIVIARYVEKGL